MPGTAGTDRRGLVAVARVAKAHGIRGELCMDSHADSPLLFAAGRTLFLAVGKARPKPYQVLSARDNNGRFLITLSGVADRTLAETLRGAEVLVPEADLPPPDEGEAYLHSLLGAGVLLADGTKIGVFEAILDTPGQLTFVITAENGAEVLFPAVPEFILGLDPKKGEIVIDPPPGLLELYLGAADHARDDGLDEQEAPVPTGKPRKEGTPEKTGKPRT